MPRVSEMFPSEFLKPRDIPRTGLVLTMKSVASGSISDRKSGEVKRTWVLSFSGQAKRLTLNKTNAAAIASMYGEDTDEWAGKPVTLVRVRGQVFDKIGWMIRVATPDDDELDNDDVELDDEPRDVEPSGDSGIPF